MTYLSRLGAAALAKEATQGTYLVPTDTIAFVKFDFNDLIVPLKDETIRANDAMLQGLYQGPWTTTIDVDTHGYPDIIGHFFRGMVGPDTVTPGVSTTLAASSTIGATTVSSTASIAATSVIAIDSAANLEYAKVTAVSGSGPYTLTLNSPLTFAHTSGAAVVAQTQHVFQQNRTSSTVWPSYSFTIFDQVETRGFPGCVMNDLAIKIDPKGIAQFSAKYIGWPSAVQSSFTPAYTLAQPQRGWTWTMNNPGASTRGLTYDVTMKRTVEAIHAATGTQAPREVFAGAMDIEGKYKAVFENTTDYQLYYNYSQGVTTATLAEPVGGSVNAGTSLTITLSKSGYHAFKPSLASAYVEAEFDLSAIFNTTDAGITTVTLKNFRSTAY